MSCSHKFVHANTILSDLQVREFQSVIWSHYNLHRRSFPWRCTFDPYLILVSEVMLQQTRCERVRKFFPHFVKKFPTAKTLARAQTSEVIRAWQGLGYNRRVLRLKRAAEMLVTKHSGAFPRTREEIGALPGVGSYTAGAILAFAFNKSAVFVETNIRSVFIHYFFQGRRKVSDAEIVVLVERTFPQENIRAWYEALMDYGAMLKRIAGNPNIASREYSRQSPFEGSRRQLRGRFLALATAEKITRGTLQEFCKSHAIAHSEAQRVLRDLVSEGFLKKEKNTFVLP